MCIGRPKHVARSPASTHFDLDFAIVADRTLLLASVKLEERKSFSMMAQSLTKPR
jgi:hypothetical protein